MIKGLSKIAFLVWVSLTGMIKQSNANPEQKINYVNFDAFYQPSLCYVDNSLSSGFYHVVKKSLLDVGSFHLFSHGRPGQLFINGRWMDAKGIAQFLVDGRYIKPGKRHINIYGCEFGQGLAGSKAVKELSGLLGISVAASTNITGIDGDWVLEIGGIDETKNFKNYQGNLQCSGARGGRAPGDDFDGDGICNLNDIDDDNDGIPDTAECSSGGYPLTGSWSRVRTGVYEAPIGTTGLKARMTFGSYATFWDGTEPANRKWEGGCIGTNSSAGPLAGKTMLGVSVAENQGSSSGALTIEFLDRNNAPVTIANPLIHFGSVGSYRNPGGTDPAIISSSEWTLQDGLTWTTLSSDDLSSTSTRMRHAQLGQRGAISSTCANGEGSGTFRIDASASVVGFNVRMMQDTASTNRTIRDGLELIIEVDMCTLDTDNDGLPNKVDLDSDGDGCLDIYESGVTGATRSGASTDSIATGPYGANGLANNLESGDNRFTEVNYRSTYGYAISSGTNLCADADRDNIGDLDDIDDDNDGVPDRTECGSNGSQLTGRWTQVSAGVLESPIGNTGIRARATFGNYTQFWDASAPTNSSWDAACNGATSPEGALRGKNMLLMSAANNQGDALGSLNIEFLNQNGRAVNITNPLIHIGRMGGSVSSPRTVSSSEWILQGGRTWATRSADDLASTSTSVRHAQLGQATGEINSCTSGEGSGTFMINGSSSAVGFDVRMLRDEITTSATLSDGVGVIIEAEVCILDTDGDSILNKLDLDSDGDNCFDTYEAGVSGATRSGASTDRIASGPYGANGLANSLESGDDQAAGINYRSTYGYAISSDASLCADTDRDGIGDLDDIDDDNDGVPDITECGSGGSQLTGRWSQVSTGVFEAPIGTTNIRARATFGNYVNFWDSEVPNNRNWDAACSGASSATGALGGKNLLSMTTANNQGEASGYLNIEFLDLSNRAIKLSNPLIHLAGVGASTAGANPTISSAEWVLQNSSTWTALTANDLTTTSTSVRHARLGMSGGTNNCSGGEGSGTLKINGSASLLGFNVRMLQSDTVENSSLLDRMGIIIEADVCRLDTDRDGILNNLDLDSDGDGCFDSYEAGVTGVTRSGASTDSIATGLYGVNGLANSLENNDTDTAKVNYQSSYSFYASSKDLDVCADTDGDGRGDLVDIDDDNDGVLDASEGLTCLNYENLSCEDIKDYRWITWTSKTGTTDAEGYIDLPSGERISVRYTGDVQSFEDAEEMRVANQYCPYNGQGGNSASQMIRTFSGIGNIHRFVFSKSVVAPIFQVFSLGSGGGRVRYDFTKDIKILKSNGEVSHPVSDDLSIIEGAEGDGSLLFKGSASVIEFVSNIAENWSGLQVAVKLASDEEGGICTSKDTDNDGISNHLDRDSDGDGCFDSYEAGVTGVTRSGASTDSIANGPYGENGLANALEDRDTDSANVNYDNKYGVYALSNAANLCADTDRDIIGDLVDIDDDNDGVLDAFESPNCFYTAAEASKVLRVSSELVSYLSNVPANTIDNNASTYNAFNGAINWVDKELYKLTLPTSLAISRMDLGLTTWALSSNANQTFKMQGSNDNVGWTDLSVPVASTANTGTFSIANTQAVPFLHYRLLGVAGNSNYGGVTEIKLIPSNYSISSHPKSICTADIDNDGIVNHLDLDSDGDGCFDSYEAGVTGVTRSGASTDSIAAGPYGTNGLAASLETNDTDSAKVNYRSTYSAYARSRALNACADTDGDGIGDLVDIDDDNDGVLDYVEGGCPNGLSEGAGFTALSQIKGVPSGRYFFNIGDSVFQADVDDSEGGGWLLALQYVRSGSNNPDLKVLRAGDNLPITSAAVLGADEKDSTTKWGHAGNAALNQFSEDFEIRFFGETNDHARKIHFYTTLGASYVKTGRGSFTGINNASNFTGLTDHTASLPLNVSTTFSDQSDLALTNFPYYALNTAHWGIRGGGNRWEVDNFPGNANRNTIHRVWIRAKTDAAPCMPTDFDGDGKPNHLDLDSDGDGCFDSYEAGVTGATRSRASTDSIAAGPYGANGLAASLENNDTDTARVNYESTYSFFAIDRALDACIDTDNDGISNLVDIDDDNDGVADKVEDVCKTIVRLSNTYASSVLDFNAAGATSGTPALALGEPEGTGADGTFYAMGNVGSSVTLDFDYPFTTSGNSTVDVELVEVGPNESGELWVYPTGNTRYKLNKAGLVFATSADNYIRIGQLTLASEDIDMDAVFGNAFSAGELRFESLRLISRSSISDSNPGPDIDAVRVLYLSEGCPDGVDTDEDGIINSLDLDSDGDGCFDSYEAIVTGSTNSRAITDSIATGPYGANGLANSLENNDTDTAKVNYNSRYTSYASSRALNVCADTDGDGIGDLVDIDDDNDGVLDASEGLTCLNYENLSCEEVKDYRWITWTSKTGTTDAEGYIDLSSGERITVQYTGDVQSFEGAGEMGAANEYCPYNGQGGNSAAQMIRTFSGVGKVHRFVFSKPVVAPVFHVFSLGAGGASVRYDFPNNVKILKSNGDLTHPVSSDLSIIQGAEGDGSVLFNGATRFIEFVASSSENWSGLQVSVGQAVDEEGGLCSSTDTDNDRIPNHLDLDSDGDGCFDSFEAGVTGATRSRASTDSIAAGPYGTNGLANSLENNDTDTARVDYEDKYALYAISNTSNVCADTDGDGDGIDDIVDIDDDNDGIPDVGERAACGVSCPSSAKGWEGRVYDNNNASDAVLWNAVNRSATPFPSSTFTQIASFDYNGFNTTCNSFDLSTDFRSGEVYGDSLRNQVSNYNGARLNRSDRDNGMSFRRVVEPGYEGRYDFSIDFGDDHILIFVNGEKKYSRQDAWTTYSKDSVFVRILTLDLKVGDVLEYNIIEEETSNTSLIIAARKIAEPLGGAPLCFVDTDGDGKPNHLDADSDGDGCFDSYEAGVTGATRSRASTDSIAAGPYGTNGLANSLENNDTDSARINYQSRYSQYAISDTLNACVVTTDGDTDGDGIGDLVDIDDDNDGIPDVGERAACGVSCPSSAKGWEGRVYDNNNASDAVLWNAVNRSATPFPSSTFTQIASFDYNGFNTTCNSFDLSTDFRSGEVYGDSLRNQVSNYNGARLDRSDRDNGMSFRRVVEPGYEGRYDFSIDFGDDHILIFVNGEKKYSRQDAWTTYRKDSVFVRILTLDLKVGDVLEYNIIEEETSNTSLIIAARKIAEPLGGAPLCFVDTDGDGKPNHLDADSDGDGCFDSYEAGVTGTTRSRASTDSIAAGPYGTNGLANSLENNDTDSARINYQSRYSQYAISDTLNACVVTTDGDTDGDGIGDLVDIDDDNDGIPDVGERAACGVSCPSSAKGWEGRVYDNNNASDAVLWNAVNRSATPFPSSTFTQIASFDYNGFNTTCNSFDLSTDFRSGEVYGDSLRNQVSNYNGARLDRSDRDNGMSFRRVVEPGYEGRYDFSIDFGDDHILIFVNGEKKYSRQDAWTTYRKDSVFVRILTLDLKVGDVLEYNIIEEETSNTSLIIAARKIAEPLGGAPLCFVDTDGDGKPNHLDADSDGDGCFDSYEAGVTGTTRSRASTDSIAAGPYGTNGLANSLENNDTDSARINYQSRYSQYAISDTLNACVVTTDGDTDGDGIGDLVDIDDDNDGILDTLESTSSCTPNQSVTGTNTSLIGWMTNSGLCYMPDSRGFWWLSETSTDGTNENYLLPATSQFPRSAGAGMESSTDSRECSFATKSGVDPANPFTSNHYVQYKITTKNFGESSYLLLRRMGWNNNASVQLEIRVSEDNFATYTTVFTPKSVNQRDFLFDNFYLIRPDKTYTLRVYFYASVSGVMGDVALDGVISSNVTCVYNVDIDTDRDGIPNRLDADSDGDGCFDSYEAGVTGATRSRASTDSIASGPYGTNGLANSLENNDTDTARINYQSRYSQYALSGTANACVEITNGDTDGDGISDLVDIDDDNDGIPDVGERAACGVSCPSSAKGWEGRVYDNNNNASDAVLWNAVNRSATPFPSSTFTQIASFDYNGFTTTCNSLDLSADFRSGEVYGDSLGNQVSNYNGARLNRSDRDNGMSFRRVVEPGYEGRYDFSIDFGDDHILIFVNGEKKYSRQDAWTTYRKDSVFVRILTLDLKVGDVLEYNIIEEEVGNTSLIIAARKIAEPLGGAPLCFVDTDGDGKPNHLDADSDGDGCFDSYEAGVTGTTKSGALTDSIAAGPYGANGLANSLENNDTDSAKVNYRSTYSAYATSRALNVCADTDGDGIGDLVDIDDDNDGIPDATEGYGPCRNSKLFTIDSVNNEQSIVVLADEANIPQMQVGLQLTSPGTRFSSPYLTQGTDVYRSAYTPGTTYSYRYNITKLGPTSFVQAEYKMRADAFRLATHSATFSIVYDQELLEVVIDEGRDIVGLKDGDIIESGTIYRSTVPDEFSTNPFTLSIRSKYPMVAGANTSIEVFQNYTSSVAEEGGEISFSGCAGGLIDTDLDGVPNYLDLDSDGDGCFDSYEAGVTGATRSRASTDSIAAGPYGANGLANSLENNDTDTARVNYANKYLQYALSRTLNVCADNDGDGITDLVDIDDDNDGVLDTDEGHTCLRADKMSCDDLKDYRWVVWTSTTGTTDADGYIDLPSGERVRVHYTGDVQSLVGAGEMNNRNEYCPYNGQGGNSASRMIRTFSGVGKVHKFVFSKPLILPVFQLFSLGSAQSPVRYDFTNDVRIMKSNGNFTYPVSGDSSIIHGAEGDGSLLFNGSVDVVEFVASAWENWSGLQVTAGFAVDSANRGSTCRSTDTDGDRIPNHLDLDSDGDGCFDSYEAGVTGATRSRASTDSIATGPYGANGLADSLENNDTDTARVDYENKYLQYAISRTSNVCADTDGDGDGIDDIVDIDDDNDGIPDVGERAACGVSCPSSAKGWEGRVYDNNSNASDAVLWNAVNRSATPFPSSTFTQIASFDYNGFNTTCNSFDLSTDFRSGEVYGDSLRNQVSNYNGARLNRSDRDNGMSFRRVVEPGYEGRYDFSIDFGDDHILIFVNGEKKYSRQDAWTTYRKDSVFVRILTLDLKVGDVLEYNIIEEEVGNTSLIIAARKIAEPLGGAPLCFVDTDGDGKPNHLDADSDGDGCFDSYEAGVTGATRSRASTDSIATGPYGANGLANSLENSDTDTAKVNYESKYTPSAVTRTLSACADIDGDGDGIDDIVDIDDDNDGVLDTLESTSSCTPNQSVTGTNTSLIGWMTNSGLCYMPDSRGFWWLSETSTDGTNENYLLPATSQSPRSAGAGMESNTDSRECSFATKRGVDPANPFTSNHYVQYKITTKNYGESSYLLLRRMGWNNNASVQLEIRVSEDNFATYTTVFTPKSVNQRDILFDNFYLIRPDKTYTLRVYFYASVSGVMGDVALDGVISSNVTCVHNVDIDTDRDGIPNRLDPDSDGDGCFDSYEAGVTGATRSRASTDSIAAGPYGTNGLANSLENNDTDTAKVNYESKYTPSAVTRTLSACSNIDSDGDGIDDLVDIDDDNDGVLDTDEGHTCLNAAKISCDDLKDFRWVVWTSKTGTTDADGYIDLPSGERVTVHYTGDVQSLVGAGEMNNRNEYCPYNGQGGNSASQMIRTFSGVGKVHKFVFSKPLILPVFQLFSLGSAQFPVRYDFTNDVRIMKSNGNFTYPVSGDSSIIHGAEGDGSLLFDGAVDVVEFVANAWENSSGLQVTAGFSVDSANRGLACRSKDTDGDRIPNHLDPDSDGDGCFDSYEAGVTGVTRSGTSTDSIAAGPYGTNGLANSVENNDTDTARVNYENKYLQYAVSDTLNACLLAPPTKDTVTVRHRCITCAVTACPVADDIAPSKVMSVSSCGTPAGYRVVGPNSNNCFRFEPTGPVTDTAEGCIVVCDSSGRCDTTIVILSYPPLPPTKDTVSVTSRCDTCSVTACPITNDIDPSRITSVSNCGTPVGYTMVGPDSNNCYRFQPTDSAVRDTVEACITVCDSSGRCDTTIVILYPPPPPTKDTVSVSPRCDTCSVTVCPVINDIDTSRITSVSSCDTPAGYRMVGPDSNNCYRLQPTDSSVKDTVETCIVICNGTRCDTTIVILYPLLPPTKDTVSVSPRCDTCSVTVCPVINDIDTSRITSVSSCDTPAGYRMVGPDSNNCYRLQPTDSSVKDTVETCIVVCDGARCDTTIVILYPLLPPTKDTVSVRPRCDTCSVTVCPVINDIDPSRITSVRTCDTPAGYRMVGPDSNNCYRLQPTDSSVKDTVETCIVVCDGARCDTTIVILYPLLPPTKDTVSVRPPCNTCEVTVCPVINDIDSSRITSVKSCGVPAGYTIMGPNSNNCYRLQPTDSSIKDTVETCIVICNGTRCDTTIVILYPLLPPTKDTVSVRSRCDTCSVTVCPVINDIDPSKITSVSSCSTPAGYTMVGPDSNNCYRLQPTDSSIKDTVETCIVICDGARCDTTIVILYPPPPPTKDTVIVFVECDTCQMAVCPVINDIDPSQVTSTMSCGTPVGYTMVGPDSNNCYQFRPTGPVEDESETCIVVCNGSRCDTTVVILNPPVVQPPPFPPTVDTVTTTPPCNTCSVIVCPVINDIDPSDITSVSSCSTPAGYTMVGPDANNCYSFQPTGPIRDTVETCIEVCNDAGRCDRTIVVLYPPSVPPTPPTPPTGPCPNVVKLDVVSNGAICKGGNTGSAMLTAEFAGGKGTLTQTYKWFNELDPDKTISNDKDLTGVAAGVYIVEVKVVDSESSCTKYYQTKVEIKQGTGRIIAMISGSTTVDRLSTPLPEVILSATGGESPYTYTYTMNGGSEITIQGDPSAKMLQSTDSVGGFVYTLLKVRDLSGCELTVDSFNKATVMVVDSSTPGPDLTTLITILPTISHGITNHIGYVSIQEIHGYPTQGTITVYLTKDAKIKLEYDSLATNIGGLFNVNNSAWAFDDSSLGFYKFTTNSVIPAAGDLRFGFSFMLNPEHSRGKLQITSAILYPSGGENNVKNNVDVEAIEYFIR